MCASQKLRRAKKAKRDEEAKRKRERLPDPKFKIAGLEYSNASKVKSKARAILSAKADGDKLEGYEEEFMKYIIDNHERATEKMADFDHFTVDKHPKFPDTRCFFVVRKSGEKEDFSMSKCIERMEEAAKEAMREERAKAKEATEAKEPAEETKKE